MELITHCYALCQLLIFIFIIKISYCDFYSSMADVSELAKMENNLADIIDNYVKAEYKRLDTIKKYAINHITHVNKMRTSQSLLAEPLNLFLFIKRLNGMQLLMKRDNADKYLGMHNRHSESNSPTDNDVIGAALALFRLQDTYQLEAKDLANGLISNSVNFSMTAAQCFELGKIAYDLEEPDYYHAILWMQEADKRLRKEKSPSMKREEILDYLSYAMYTQDNVERALVLSRKLRDIDPSRNLINENIDYYENVLEQNGIGTRNLDEKNLPKLKLSRDLSHRPPWFEKYESLCRGEGKLSQKIHSKLTCYFKENRPFLRLARLKVEVLHLNPRILLFKNVVSDGECAAMQNSAAPKFERAGIVRASGNFEASDRRTSKIAWLQEREYPVVQRITKRVEDMTDLTCDTAEYMQVSNYGIGGHYEAHFDFVTEDATPGESKTFDEWNAGNRIATILFYLSQPTAGGATVFPDLDLTLQASKNDAVFWYNLLKNGKGDNRLRHAACPVLSGVKWVANKWLHEYGQEFFRRCPVDKNDND